ncbi:aquaporin-5 isoform X2 [Anguilla rostrata]|uniref:aquaporin-5 isoform X2 n=1 Tax=Anguilla rostrata TaxID=7938 RepID=UPI0030D3FFC5
MTLWGKKRRRKKALWKCGDGPYKYGRELRAARRTGAVGLRFSSVSLVCDRQRFFAELLVMRVLSRLALVLKDARTQSFLRDVLCEFVGTALFLFAGLASVVLWQGAPGSEGAPGPDPSPVAAAAGGWGGPSPAFLSACLPDPLRVGLAFGTALALVSLCLGPATSGGVHLNPAVTLAMVVGLRATPWRAVLYVGAQLLGALCACTLLRGLKPTPLPGPMGLNELGPGVCPYQALSVEAAVTFLLVLCVAVAARPKSPLGRLGPAAVGLSVVLGHLVAVYWAGPCAGAVLAVAVHDLLLHPRWGCPGDWLAELREVFLTGQRQPARGPERAGE